MNMVYPPGNRIWITLFFIVMTLSFSPQFPDMDFMPRMLTASFYIIPFSVLAFFACSKSGFILPKSILNNWPLLSLFVFTLVILRSSSQSINPGDSLFEVLKFSLALAYLILSSVLLFKYDQPLKIVSRSVLLSHSIVLIGGIWQVYTLIQDAEKKHYVFQIDYQVSSLLSTKNSLGEFLLLALPLIIYCCVKDKGAWKQIAIINAFLCLISICLLKSFSVFVALVAAIILVSFLVVFAFKNQLMIKTGWSKNVFYGRLTLLFIILMCTLFLGINKADGFKKLEIAATYISGKTTNEGFNNNSVFERLLLWRNSVSMIKEHPLSGVGLSNWKILFPSYGYSGAAYLTDDSIKFTRPHNDFLQIFAETGIIGFLSYLTFLISILCLIIKNFFQSKDSSWLFLLSGIVIFFIVSLFGFPMERVLILIMMIVYASLAISMNAKRKEADSRQSKGILTIVVTAAILLSIFSIKVCLARVSEEIVYKKLIYQKERGNWQRMYQLVQHSSIKYFPVDYMATPVNWYAGTAYYMNGNLKEALTYYKKAEEAAPYHVQIKNDIGATYLNSGDYKTSQIYFSEALAINPRFFEAKLNRTFAVYNSGNKYGAYQMLKELYENDKWSQKYYDNMTVILNALADSVFRKSNINVKTDPAWATKFTKQYMWTLERSADSSKTNFIELLNKEVNLFSNN